MTQIITGLSVYECRECGRVMDHGEAADPAKICNRCFLLIHPHWPPREVNHADGP